MHSNFPNSDVDSTLNNGDSTLRWLIVLIVILRICVVETQAEESDIRVMSFNIYRGGTMRGQPLSQTANVIREAQADIVGLQEPRSPQGFNVCLLYTSPSPRDGLLSRMPSSA